MANNRWRRVEKLKKQEVKRQLTKSKLVDAAINFIKAFAKAVKMVIETFEVIAKSIIEFSSDIEDLFKIEKVKQMNFELYKGGFCVTGENPYETEEWLFRKELSNETKLVFQGYDANLCPLPNFSERIMNDWNKKVIAKAMRVTKDFKGDVWLDDCQIKFK